jgi:hypothetical protein
MTPPINIDGSEVTGITIDGTEVSEVTVDGQTVFAPNAIPDTVDGFEDQDLSEYKQDTGSWSIATVSGPQWGDYAIETTTRSSLIAATKSTGLENNLSAGDTFEYWAYFGDTSDTSNAFKFGYGVSDASNVSRRDDYQIGIRPGNNSMYYQGDLSDSDTTSTTIPTKEWLRVEVGWESSGSHTAKLFKKDGTEIKSVSGTDSSISTGGIYLVNMEDTSATYRVDSIGIL